MCSGWSCGVQLEIIDGVLLLVNAFSIDISAFGALSNSSSSFMYAIIVPSVFKNFGGESCSLFFFLTKCQKNRLWKIKHIVYIMMQTRVLNHQSRTEFSHLMIDICIRHSIIIELRLLLLFFFFFRILNIVKEMSFILFDE